jgi:Beta-xylosidase
MKKSVLVLLATLLGALQLSSRPATQTEPVPFADPCVFFEDGIYYMYGTLSGEGTGVLVSDNLKVWYVPDNQPKWVVFGTKEVSCLSPEVYRSGDIYCLTILLGDKRITAISDSPLGPFVQDDNAPARQESSQTCKCLSRKRLASARISRNPADGFYTNPVRRASTADPSLIRDDDGNYYLVSTEHMGSVTIKKSHDLVNWSDDVDIFSSASRPDFVKGGHVWAPDISKVGSEYVTYYSMSTWGGEWAAGIGRATAPSVDGPWKDHGKLFISSEIGIQNCIDPVLVADKGKNYLFWGSFHGIYGIELDAEGICIAPGASPVQVAGTAYEGTYILKRGRYYYLFASTGSCCEGMRSTYKTVVGRSKNLFGPYLDKSGRPMLENHHEVIISGTSQFAGPGHDSEIVTDDAGRTWILYHSFWSHIPEGRRMLMLDEVFWDRKGWPYVRSASHPAIVARRPTIRAFRDNRHRF